MADQIDWSRVGFVLKKALASDTGKTGQARGLAMDELLPSEAFCDVYDALVIAETTVPKLREIARSKDFASLEAELASAQTALTRALMTIRRMKLRERDHLVGL